MQCRQRQSSTESNGSQSSESKGQRSDDPQTLPFGPRKKRMGREVPAAIHSNRSAIAGQTADTVLGLAPLDDNRGDCNKKRKRKIMSGATATAQCPSRGAAHVASPSVRSDPDPSAGGGAALPHLPHTARRDGGPGH